jgi:hypothetical protein
VEVTVVPAERALQNLVQVEQGSGLRNQDPPPHRRFGAGNRRFELKDAANYLSLLRSKLA